MRALLAALGDPQLAYPAIHVVGTNGKSTATRTIEALLLAEGLSVGATVSPHVRGWAERITVDGAEADFEAAVARVRPAGGGAGGDPVRDDLRGRVRRVRGARGRRGGRRGGARRPARRDERPAHATSSCSRTSASSTRTCSARRGRRSRPRSSRSCRRGRSPCCRTSEFAAPRRRRTSSLGGAREAAAAFLGRPVAAEVEVALPGRLERRGDEVRDGAHNPDGAALARRPARARRLHARRLDPARQGRRRDAGALARGRPAARRDHVVERPRAPGRGARDARAAVTSRAVETVAGPGRRARPRAPRRPPVLVTGSLYLLADLDTNGEERRLT